MVRSTCENSEFAPEKILQLVVLRNGEWNRSSPQNRSPATAVCSSPAPPVPGNPLCWTRSAPRAVLQRNVPEVWSSVSQPQNDLMIPRYRRSVWRKRNSRSAKDGPIAPSSRELRRQQSKPEGNPAGPARVELAPPRTMSRSFCRIKVKDKVSN